MTVDWINALPAWLSGPLVVGLSLAGLFAARYLVHHRWGLSEALIDNGVVGWFFSGLMVLYGVTLGLVAVATWNASIQASELASREAAALAAHYRDLDGYPEPLREALRRQLRAYVRQIIEEAWPAQRRGEAPASGDPLIEAFLAKMLTFEPGSLGRQVAHAEALRAFNRVVERRRQRIEAAHWAVPGVLWSVVLLGAVLSLGCSYCFHLKGPWLHALLVGMLAAMVGLLVFLVAALDRPYRGGAASMSPQAYEFVLERVMKDAR